MNFVEILCRYIITWKMYTHACNSPKITDSTGSIYSVLLWLISAVCRLIPSGELWWKRAFLWRIPSDLSMAPLWDSNHGLVSEPESWWVYLSGACMVLFSQAALSLYTRSCHTEKCWQFLAVVVAVATIRRMLLLHHLFTPNVHENWNF